MVVTLDPEKPAVFPVSRTNIVLGKSKMADFIDPEEEIEIDSSAKHHLFSTYRYFGAPGNYLHYFFGEYEAYNVFPTEEELINWVAVTDYVEKDRPYFDWAHFE